MSSIPPTKIGRYKIISELGSGGMGTVYKALDPVLGRDIALKVGNTSNFNIKQSNNEALAMLLKEARVAAQFIHPHIAITYDAGLEKKLFYMALEHIDGPGLDHHAQKPHLLPRSQIIECIYNICYALDYIHNKGYIHLDIKPSNLMLTSRGEIKLMDFGIANLIKENTTRDQKIIGSPLYMSPEQINPKCSLNHLTDIYSLGVVLYTLIAGRCPYGGKNPYEIFFNITNNKPYPLRKYVPDISPDLELIISKAMNKDKNERFKTAKDFAEALFPVLKGKDSVTLNKQAKEKIEDLRKLLFFKHFQYADLMKILEISSWSFHEKQSWIINGKNNDNKIYFIVRGKASLHTPKEQKIIKQGSCFGEVSVFINMPRAIKIMAETDCVIMAINANILNQSEYGLQVKFLKEFFKNKTVQLVDANLKLIQAGLQPH